MVLDKRHIIHPQAILRPERAANLRLESILAMAKVFVTLHNDILSAPMKGGFAFLDDKVSPALMENSALFDFGEMARICPWINKQVCSSWTLWWTLGSRMHDVCRMAAKLRFWREPGHSQAEHRQTTLASPRTRPQWTG